MTEQDTVDFLSTWGMCKWEVCELTKLKRFIKYEYLVSIVWNNYLNFAPDGCKY